jgi:hypothetical protein
MTRRRVVVVAITIISVATVARAQQVVFDPSNTFQNALTAAIKDDIVHLLGDQLDELQQIARRLSVFTDLRKYAMEDIPEWRIHLFQFEQYLFANGFNASLNYGDGAGAGFAEVARQRVLPDDALAVLAGADRRTAEAIRAQLATLDLADSSIIIGTDQTGHLRYNGRQEHEAIDDLQSDVINPSEEQSAAAVLDKISGAGLIRSRQQQARIQFLAAIVEQLLVDNKRSRDTEAAAMNMRLEALRDGHAAATALVAGLADDLRAWRQP